MTGEEDPDDKLFAEAMRGVRPVGKVRARVQPAIARASVLKKEKERIKPVELPAMSSPELHSGEQPWTFCVSGISRDRLRRLAVGSAGREIDLHGSTRHEALINLESIVQTALTEGVRTLCIVHGKGLHSQGKPVLKQSVFQWLREGPYAAYVLAVVPKAGSGGGASMVLFRREKS